MGPALGNEILQKSNEFPGKDSSQTNFLHARILYQISLAQQQLNKNITWNMLVSSLCWSKCCCKFKNLTKIFLLYVCVLIFKNKHTESMLKPFEKGYKDSRDSDSPICETNTENCRRRFWSNVSFQQRFVYTKHFIA